MSAQQTLQEVIFSHNRPAVRSSSILANRLPLPREQALPTESRTYEVGKRILDVCFAFLLLPIAVPMMVLIGIAIGLTSGWPLIYSQRRVGRYGRPFKIWKFRTMHPEGERILSAHFERCAQARVEWQKTASCATTRELLLSDEYFGRPASTRFPRFSMSSWDR